MLSRYDLSRPDWRNALLWPASLLYGAGWRVYRALYDVGLKRASEPHPAIVCVGNLVVGGTGKTPLTRFIAETLIEAGRTVVIGLSGYGSPSAEAAQIAPDGPLDARQWGDEPATMRQWLPDVPLVVGRRRVLAATLCAERFPGSVLLMDDGLQHLPLRKRLTIVVRPPEGTVRWMLPAGPYREPPSEERRYDLHLPGEFEWVQHPTELIDREGQTVSGWDLASPIHLLCGVGRPDRLLAALEAIGVKPDRVTLLGDHEAARPEMIRSGESTILTRKDWVKIEAVAPTDARIVIADYRVSVEPRDRFRAWLLDHLHES